jgi:hypothetical protein
MQKISEGIDLLERKIDDILKEYIFVSLPISPNQMIYGVWQCTLPVISQTISLL